MEITRQNLSGKIQSRAGLGSSAISSLLFVIIPKCPVCLAAYSTFFTAIGVNASVLLGIRIGLSALLLISVTWLTLGAFRKRNYLSGLGLITGTVLVLSSWIIETPIEFEIGSVGFLTIVAFWVVHSRKKVSKSRQVDSCEQC